MCGSTARHCENVTVRQCVKEWLVELLEETFADLQHCSLEMGLEVRLVN